MEGSNQVFAAQQIDAGFAADGGVHLREQGGGNLDDRDAAHEDGGQKAADVAADTAAEGDDDA